MPASPVAKAGAKGFTAFYRAAPGAVIPSRHFTAGRKQGICDLLSTGTQTVLPPSPHPAGHAYRWLAADTLLTVPASELPEAPADLAGRLEDALAPWMPKPRFDARYERRTTPPAGHELRRLTAFAKSALSRLGGQAGGDGGRRAEQHAVRPGLGPRQVRHSWNLDAAVIEAAALAACQANGMRRADGRLAVLATLHSGIARAKGDALPALKERTFKRRKPARERGLSVSQRSTKSECDRRNCQEPARRPHKRPHRARGRKPRPSSYRRLKTPRRRAFPARKRRPLSTSWRAWSALEFALVQKERAKQLGMSQTKLDRAVNERRKELKAKARAEAPGAMESDGPQAASFFALETAARHR